MSLFINSSQLIRQFSLLENLVTMRNTGPLVNSNLNCPFFRVLPFFPRFTLFRVFPFFPRFTLFSAFYPFFHVFPLFSVFYPLFRVLPFFPLPPFRFRVLPLPLSQRHLFYPCSKIASRAHFN